MERIPNRENSDEAAILSLMKTRFEEVFAPRELDVFKRFLHLAAIPSNGFTVSFSTRQGKLLLFKYEIESLGQVEGSEDFKISYNHVVSFRGDKEYIPGEFYMYPIWIHDIAYGG